MFPLLEHLIFQYSRMPYVDDPDKSCNIPPSDFHSAFKGSLELKVYSCDSQTRLFAAFTDHPLGYNTIRINVGPIDEETVPAEVINRLTSRCHNTLEVLETKSGPAQMWSYPPHSPPITDSGLNLSPFRCLREISLVLMVDRGLGHLPNFSTITSGVVSRVTITARLGSRAKELNKSFGGTGHD